MQIIEVTKTKSRIDNTIKYVFLMRDKIDPYDPDKELDRIVEASYIDKNDGKDIICVSCQTGCNLGCSFCHLTGSGKESLNLSVENITRTVNYIFQDLDLSINSNDKTLLVSYMGIGEPLHCIKNVTRSASQILDTYKGRYGIVRFGMSTSLTTPALMSKLISAVGEHGLNMKLHYSLHSANSKMRKMLIPSHSTPTLDGLNELSKYKRVTGNDVEIHYTMIKGKNDWPSDLDLLTILLAGRDMSIKFLSFNTKEGLDYKPAKEKTRNKFMAHLNDRGIETEYYEAPGADVGASCGMFTV